MFNANVSQHVRAVQTQLSNSLPPSCIKNNIDQSCFLPDPFSIFGIDGSNGFRQISVICRVVHLQSRRWVILQQVKQIEPKWIKCRSNETDPLNRWRMHWSKPKRRFNLNLVNSQQLTLRIQGKTGYWLRSLYDRPAIVFNWIKYSKLEISRLIHFCVNPELFNKSAGLRAL